MISDRENGDCAKKVVISICQWKRKIYILLIFKIIHFWHGICITQGADTEVPEPGIRYHTQRSKKMAFTEKDFQAQQAQLKELEEELSRLNAEFEAQKKAAGLSDADLAEPIDPATLSPEVRKIMAEAEAQAKRAGEARRTQASLASSSSTAKAPGAGRRGIIRM